MRTLAIAVLLAAEMQGQPPAKQVKVDLIFSVFNPHTPGCSVGVAQNGVMVFKAGYGMADLERNVPITPDTVFESGSVATQFTAAAVLLLAQQGKISLDDPIGEMTYRIGSNAPVTQRPTFRDGFKTPLGSSICFIRDASGKVIALSAGDDRVWDLRFQRVR